MTAEGTGDQDASEPFDAAALKALNSKLTHADGIEVGELSSLLDEHFKLPRNSEDLQSYREGEKPWKKLADEVVPVAAYLRQTGAAGRVRFPLDDQPPDAWFHEAGAEKPVGIEVTRVQGRARVELARDLRDRPVGRGFLGLSEDAPQKVFDQARARGRVTTTRHAVEKAIEDAAITRLVAKADAKFEGHTLLLVAPLGSAPEHDWAPLRERLALEAQKTAFARVVLMDDVRPSQPLIAVLDRTTHS